MAQGFITGALTGCVIAAGLGAVGSVMAPLPPQGVANVAAGAVPAVAVAPVPSDASVPVLPREEAAAPGSPSAVLGATPPADTLVALENDAQEPGASPDLTAVVVEEAQPVPFLAEDLPSSGAIAARVDEPVTRNETGVALDLPPPPDSFSVRTTPVVRPLIARSTPPDVDSETGAEALLTQTVAAGTNAPSVEVDVTAPSRAARPSAVGSENTDAAALPEVAETSPSAPVTPPGSPAPVNRPVAATGDAMPAQTVLAQADTTGAATIRPRIGKPARTLTDGQAGIVVNRPTVTTTEEAEPQPAALPQTGATEATEAADKRPVIQHRQPFENADEKPLMSIVLIDDGSTDVGTGTSIAELRDFPYAISFAVDSALPDAQERVSMYRGEGFEVLGMIDLPPGALPTDAETTLGVLLPQMGEIVGVLEGTGAGLQESRAVADQVTAILAETGHGLVAQGTGLNTMPNLARKVGVPAAPIFRDFDGKGQDARVIRRFLDQAAFRAGQEGAVIMLGRLQAETVSALLVWGLQDRAGQVALAPVSAVLLRDDS